MIENIYNIRKKTAFVLGGSGLIGSAVIQKLKLLKCKTINLDIVNKDKSNNFYKFDYTKSNISKNYKDIIKKFGLPDIFINCAYPKTKDWSQNNFNKIKIDSLKKNLENQLACSSFLIREVAENSLKNKKKCNIVMLSSIYGLVGQDRDIYKGTDISENVSYSIIKGGIINLTKQMGSYYSKHNIRVNNVSPGGVYDKSKKNNKKYQKLLRNYSNRCPMKRMAKPEEIADSIIFLSTDMSSYISGITLIVDGGWTSI